MTLAIPKDKLIDIMNLCHCLCVKPSAKQKTIARLIGKLVAVAPAFSLAFRFLWPLLNAIDYSKEWFEHVALDSKVRAGLRRLKAALARVSSRSFNPNPPRFVLHTDAAPTGWGAILHAYHPRDPSKISSSPSPFRFLWAAGGPWSPEQSVWPIARLETLAILKAVKLITPSPPLSAIQIYTDNQNSLSYLRKGGRVRYLQDLYCKIIDTISRCGQGGLTLFSPKYIPSEENKIPDVISRVKSWSQLSFRRLNPDTLSYGEISKIFSGKKAFNTLRLKMLQRSSYHSMELRQRNTAGRSWTSSSSKFFVTQNRASPNQLGQIT
jgi:hypothetical protein